MYTNLLGSWETKEYGVVLSQKGAQDCGGDICIVKYLPDGICVPTDICICTH